MSTDIAPENIAISTRTIKRSQKLLPSKPVKLPDSLDEIIGTQRPDWFIQCSAKRADGKQCTRNIKKGSEYCMGHSIKCIYGNYISGPSDDKNLTPVLSLPDKLGLEAGLEIKKLDLGSSLDKDDIESITSSIGNASIDTATTGNSDPTQPKKRGRRRKLPIDPRFGNSEFIIMWPVICEDQRYLTDRFDNIYSNDPNRPVFIGVKEVSGRINRLAFPRFG